MKKALCVLFLVACSSSQTTATDAGTDAAVTDAAEDVPSMEAAADVQTNPLVAARPYTFKVVGTYDGKPTPLLVMLHGYTSNGAQQESYLQFGNLKKTFLYAYPDGLKDGQGNRFWNATDACCNFGGNPVDDVAYIDAIIEDVAMKYAVDRKRIFVFGHSNGGFMAHRLACDLSPKIAAIGSLAGAVFADASKCKATDKVAVLQVHGTMDGTIAYGGGTIIGKAYPSAVDTVATWATKNGCTGGLVDTNMPIDIEGVIAGSETTVARWTCTSGAAELWSIQGGVHVPPLQPAFASMVWDFFTAHPKP
jgi:polyhydroxybutyrate depolymerase